MLRHGSLFSGIGGFDLAAEWMGWANVFHCEYDPFCQRVLKHHFPNSKLYNDVKAFDATAYAGRIDILTGGFPCQPFSSAGLRKGTEDERHLWPSMLRIIREVSPKYVVGENVRGLLNWSGGLVFEEVCADLEAEGYEVTPYILPACGKNAPHRRDRIWFIAHSNDSNDRRTPRQDESKGIKERLQERNEVRESIKSSEVFQDATNSDSRGLEGAEKERRNGLDVKREGEFGNAPDTSSKRPQRREKGQRTKGRKQPNDKQSKGRDEFQRENFEMFPTQSPICGGDDGLPKELDGITFPKWRKESIKAYGNAIVPAVAHEIFKAIQKMEEQGVEA
jgi:DNA (cytosine-5)-methyltransferase 1